jgi:hypothetical protein
MGDGEIMTEIEAKTIESAHPSGRSSGMLPGDVYQAILSDPDPDPEEEADGHQTCRAFLTKEGDRDDRHYLVRAERN